jgi:DNA-binding HxlR family transcriptional regulator
MGKKLLPRHFGCATEFTLAVLGGKWKTVILCYLKQRPLRYGELRALLPKLSDKVLSERLGELERAGLVARSAPPRANGNSAYRLTRLGASLGAVLGPLYAWGESHAAPFGVTCDTPLAHLDRTPAAGGPPPRRRAAARGRPRA